jgi:hypothetical protein
MEECEPLKMEIAALEVWIKMPSLASRRRLDKIDFLTTRLG